MKGENPNAGSIVNGDAGDNTLTGSDRADILRGFAGNDRLDGGLGADIMEGGIGNDVYVVDDAGDVVTEGPGAPPPVDFVPPAGFTVLGRADLTGDGLCRSVGHQRLGQPDLADGRHDRHRNAEPAAVGRLAGAGLHRQRRQRDRCSLSRRPGGSQWQVSLNGFSVGANFPTSGQTALPFDGYQVTGDVPDGGTDTVEASIDYTLTDGVENLILTGVANLSGAGNAGDNTITGNDGNNILTGAAGNDALDGRPGQRHLSLQSGRRVRHDHGCRRHGRS